MLYLVRIELVPVIWNWCHILETEINIIHVLEGLIAYGPNIIRVKTKTRIRKQLILCFRDQNWQDFLPGTKTKIGVYYRTKKLFKPFYFNVMICCTSNLIIHTKHETKLTYFGLSCSNLSIKRYLTTVVFS